MVRRETETAGRDSGDGSQVNEETRELMAHGQDETDQIAPQEWIDALDRSDADIAAGRVVSGDGLMQRLRESIAEMKAERALGKVRRTSTRR